MSDIVERLRHVIKTYYTGGQPPLIAEAADEIECLRALNAEILVAIKRLMDQPTCSPVNMTPDERKELWASHELARSAIARAEADAKAY